MTKLMTPGARGKKQGVGLRPQPQPTVISTPTMTDLWRQANDRLIWAHTDELSYWSSLDSMISDCMGLAEQATFKMNIGKELWVTPMRWSTLIRQYVDPERLFTWLEAVKDISTYNRGIAALDMNPVQRTVVASNARANRRKHGGCMRMVTYRAFPQPTVTLFSRTSYLGYIGGLDMLCAYKLIEQACDMIGDGLKPEEFSFRWVCDTWQFHGFKSMSYLFASKQDKFMKISDRDWDRKLAGKTFRGHPIYPLEDMPTWRLIRYWWKRMAKHDEEGKLYQDMKYGAEKRIRRRYHAQTGIDQTPYLGDREKEYGKLTTPIELITLDKMLYKTPESRAVLRKQRLERAQKFIDDLLADDELIMVDPSLGGVLG